MIVIHRHMAILHNHMAILHSHFIVCTSQFASHQVDFAINWIQDASKPLCVILGVVDPPQHDVFDQHRMAVVAVSSTGKEVGQAGQQRVKIVPPVDWD